MNSLKARIKQIAENMDGFFYEREGVQVPHSVFVEWDQTWDLFEGEDERWVYDYFMDEEYSVTPNSTDEEIKITTCLDDGRLLVETMKWDGNLVTEGVK